MILIVPLSHTIRYGIIALVHKKALIVLIGLMKSPKILTR